MIPSLMYIPRWIETAPLEVLASSEGHSFCSSMGHYPGSHPYIYYTANANSLNRYNPITKQWNFVGASGIAVGFGTGSNSCFVPSWDTVMSQYPGSTSRVINIGQYNPTVGQALGTNVLQGARIRISYHNGTRIVTEHTWVVENTPHTSGDDGAFTITIDPPLSAEPQGMGQVYFLGYGFVYACGSGALGTNIYRSFNTMNNRFDGEYIGASGDRPASLAGQTSFVVVDPLYVPAGRHPSEGMIGTDTYDNGQFRCIRCDTGCTSTTFVAKAGYGLDDIVADQFKGYYIQMVDATTYRTYATIASNTAGPNPVFTLTQDMFYAASEDDKFIIHPPSLIFMWTNSDTTTYVTSPDGYRFPDGSNLNSGYWNKTYFAPRPIAPGAGCLSLSGHGLATDIAKGIRPSQIHSFRGAAAARLDIFDWSQNTWESDVTYDGKSAGFALDTGSCGVVVPGTEEGRYAYINNYNVNIVNQMRIYDLFSRRILPFTSTDRLQTGTTQISSRMAAFSRNGQSTVFLALMRGQNFLEYPINPTR